VKKVLLLTLFLHTIIAYSQVGEDGCCLLKLEGSYNIFSKQREIPISVMDSLERIMIGLDYHWFKKTPKSSKSMCRSIQYVLEFNDYYFVAYEIVASRLGYSVFLIIYKSLITHELFSIADRISKRSSNALEMVNFVNSAYRRCTEVCK
jgi:hypothetical protein